MAQRNFTSKASCAMSSTLRGCAWPTRTRQNDRARTETTFGIITMMLMIMSALIAAVGAIGLAGTLSINVLERRREIGVMRAIGASSPTIAAPVHRRGSDSWACWRG